MGSVLPRRRKLFLHAGLCLLAGLLLCAFSCEEEEESEPPPPPPLTGSIFWEDPIASGNITAEAGCSLGGRNRCRPDHTGIDIAVPTGTWVSAAAEGTVKVAERNSDPTRGKYVEIEHVDADGTVYTSFYWHLNTLAGWVRPNAHAWTDSILAYSGDSGNATGHPHLHFGIRRNGQLVNPLDYIPANHFTNGVDPNCGETSCARDCPCYNPAQPLTCGSCPSAAPAPSPSQNGGLESLPPWLWQGGDAAGEQAVPPLWKWANGPLRSLPSASRRAASAAGASYQISLPDMLPAAPAGLSRVLTEPRDVLGFSNAIEAGGADYVDPATGGRRAAVVAFRTVGSVYAHDYGICSRFKAGRIVRVAPVAVADELGLGSPVYFWGARMDVDEISREYATVFAVYVSEDERSFAVDSRWISSQYPLADAGYILTFQVWAGEPRLSGQLARAILEQLAKRGKIEFRNTTAPPDPRVFITKAVYREGAVEMIARNSGPGAESLDIEAVAWRAPYPESEVRFHFTPTAQPGLSVLRLPMPGILNAVVYLKDSAGFVDALYVADGQWYAFADGGSAAEVGTATCVEPSNLRASDRFLPGCGQLKGQVGAFGYAGMGRSLDPPGRAAEDASGYGALTFFARGDGKSYRVALETHAVLGEGSFDFHQATFSAGPEWRQFVIPLAALRQRGFEPPHPVTLTAEDVKSVIWSAVGAPLAGIRLEVERAAFTNSTLLRDTTRLVDTGRVQGSYEVTTSATDDVGLRSVELLYSTDGGRSFRRLAMEAGGNLHRGAIPAQPLGTEVRYYVEAADGDGNVATDPFDAPVRTYRFQVGKSPHKWVDDFLDTDPANLRDGEAWTFRGESGTIDAFYEEGALRLAYDVSAVGSFAGYVEPLNGLDLSGVTALTFQVRGARGGERVKIGLRDGSGVEQKIPLGQYLRTGVTTSWQRAEIPLAAFGMLGDWRRTERFVVAFEQGFGSGRGALFLDDIRFEDLRPVPAVVVDNFNEPTGFNGVGGELSTSLGGGARMDSVYDAGHRVGASGAGLRLSWSGVRGKAWAAANSDLADLDASRFKKISFSIRGARGGERPNLYLASRVNGAERRAFVDVEAYGRLGRSWRRISIPLSAFASRGIALGHLAYLQVVFEGGEGAGTVYLDDIRIEP